MVFHILILLYYTEATRIGALTKYQNLRYTHSYERTETQNRSVISLKRYGKVIALILFCVIPVSISLVLDMIS